MTSFALTTVSPVLDASAQLEAELKVLVQMLAYMRPAGSKTEKAFIKRFIAPLGAKPDNYGNYWLSIGQSNVLWSSHTDTVHKQGGGQTVRIEGSMASAVNSDCLGADCTTGVWIMRQMILAGVPGTYVFHRSEERGGIGSAAVASHASHMLDGIKFAIAFDRKGVDSVITHQMYGRCCSEAFVASIARQLPGAYKSDDGGTFTDTANYADIIPECTNISVGYYNQHTEAESQDLAHAFLLAEAMMQFDETQLVAERDPNAPEVDYDFPSRRGGPNEQAIMAAWGTKTQAEIDEEAFSRRPANGNDGSWRRASTPRSILDIVRDYPHEVADILEQYGYGVEELMSELGLWRN